MTEYGPDFFRYYLDRLDEKISYPDPRDTNIMDRIPPKVQQQMQKNMEKRSQSGLVPITSPADLERITNAIRNPEQQEIFHKWGAAKCGMSQNYDRKTGRCVDRPIDPENFRPPEGFDPCPGKSQTLDPKTGRCVSAFNMRDIIDRIQNDPMLQPQLKEQGDEKEEAKQQLKDIMGQLEDLGQEAAGIMQQHFPQTYRSGDAYGAFEFGWSRNQYDTTFASLLNDLDEEDPDGMYEE